MLPTAFLFQAVGILLTAFFILRVFATEHTARQSRNQKTLATEGTEFTEILAKDNAGHG